MEKCYGIKGQERLSCSPEDVVLGIFEEADVADYPFPLVVYVSQREEISLSGKDIIEDILLGLDEGCGDPDGDYTDPTDAMLSAANVLAEAIKRDYRCAMCVPTGETIVFSRDEVIQMLEKHSHHK